MSAQVGVRRMEAAPEVAAAQSSWESLYKVAGAAALVAAVLFLSDFVVLIAVGMPPASASEWFTLLQTDRITGLLELFFSDLIGIALMAPIALALYAALRRVNAAYATMAAVLAFIGIAAILASNSNYALIQLSDQYAAATDTARQTQLLAAAESVLASGGMYSTGTLVAGLLLEGALVMFSVMMLGSKAFGKRLGYLGIAAHGLDLLHAIVFLTFIPIFNLDAALSVGTPLLAIGGALQLLWYPWTGWRLLRLSRGESPDSADRD